MNITLCLETPEASPKNLDSLKGKDKRPHQAPSLARNIHRKTMLGRPEGAWVGDTHARALEHAYCTGDGR